MASSSTAKAIEDGILDIAMRISLEKMMTEADGRQPLQRVYLWASANKTTNQQYRPLTDGPDVAGACPVLPAPTELFPVEEDTKQYLEVGLIFGNEPDKYIAKGKSRDKQRDLERQQRGILRRDTSAMRVFIPATEHCATQAKFYVGCRPTNGRLYPRVIPVDQIFFYAEFWDGIDVKLPAKNRLTEVSKACRQHAATNKTASKGMAAAITPDEMAKKLASAGLGVTKSNHLIHMILLQLTFFSHTRDRDTLQSIQQSLKDSNEKFQYNSETSTDGVWGFMDFNEELTDELALQLTKDVKSVHQFEQLDTSFIKKIHNILRNPDNESKEGNDIPKLGQRLPQKSLVFFLLTVHETMEDVQDDEHIMTVLVVQALAAAKRYARLAPEIGIINGGTGNDSIGNTAVLVQRGNEGMTTAEFRRTITVIRALIGELKSFHGRGLQKLVEDHGGILQHSSIKDLMRKMAAAIDKETLNIYLEQLAALQAAHIAGKNYEVVKFLEDLDTFLEKALLITERQMEGN